MPAKNKITKRKSTRSSKQDHLRYVPGFLRTRLTMLIFMGLFAGVGAVMLINTLAAPNVPRDKATWDKISPTLRQCESGNNPTAHNKSGKYHGLYQFDIPTWNSNKGGITNASDPHLASRDQQDAVAFKLFQARGLQPWEGKCANQAGAAYSRSGGNPSSPSSGGGSCESQTLRKGSRGDCVKYLQNKLNNHGYGIGADGDFGARTDSAVRDFQSKRGLTSDGVVGPATWRALNSGSAAQPAPAPSQSSSNRNPIGSLDDATRRVAGWACDKDEPTKSIEVHVYIDDQAGSANGKLIGAASKYTRDDVTSSCGGASSHGYVMDLGSEYCGRTAHIYPINTPSGNNPLLAHRIISC